jgi:sugar transferase (PEP-CTERM/EpsH1 system associated)
MELKGVFPTPSLLANTGPNSRCLTPVGAGPLRILHVINRLDMGGTEYGILKVIEGLGEGTFEHRICTGRGHNAELARESGLDGKLFAAGRPNRRFQLLVSRFARIMRQYRPHIVHSRNWGSIEAVFAARLAGVPVVVHSEHGYELDILEGLPLRRRLVRQAAYALSDAIMTVTTELRKYHARQVWYYKDRIRVLHNGVDTGRFAPRPAIQAELRQKFGIPASSLVLGSVGRLVAIKDHLTLLKAARTLADRGIDLCVLVAGDGPELSRLQSEAGASPSLSGRVRFLGAVRNVSEVLNALDVFVQSSLSEGMSNTLLEAMSTGLPVVATRVGGNLELVEDGCSGFLVAPESVAELSSLLERLAKDPVVRRNAGTMARQRILELFSLEQMIAGYRNLYLELAAQRGILAARSA